LFCFSKKELQQKAFPPFKAGKGVPICEKNLYILAIGKIFNDR
jgi:hypothetical protein